MKPGRLILIGIGVVAVLAIGVRTWRRHRAAGPISPAAVQPATAKPLPDSAYDTHAPDSVRIKVEIINATDIHGLARRATQYLRDRGFDVVLISGTKIRNNQTMVYDRSNHPDWAHLVAKAMAGRVETHPDTTRYVDVTVFLGKNWAPPDKPFHP